LKQFAAVNTKESYTVVMKHSVPNAQATVAAHEQNGIIKANPAFWYKVNQNMVGDPNDLVPAVKMLHVGMKNSAGHPVIANMSKNPLEHHTIICDTSQTTRKLYPGTPTVVSPCETPGYVIQWALSNFSQRGDIIVVAGSGAGGDVCGALEWGANVFAIDSDARQVELLRNDLLTFDMKQSKLADLATRKKPVQPQQVKITWRSPAMRISPRTRGSACQGANVAVCRMLVTTLSFAVCARSRLRPVDRRRFHDLLIIL
jgi:hypothetical protein